MVLGNAGCQFGKKICVVERNRLKAKAGAFEKFLGGPAWHASSLSVIFKFSQLFGNKQDKRNRHVTDCLVKMYDSWKIDALQQLWKGYGVFDLVSLFFNDRRNILTNSGLCKRPLYRRAGYQGSL